jgi:hypothetical protein
MRSNPLRKTYYRPLKLTFTLLYVFFWVILRRLNFICRRFGALCLFHLHRQVGIYLLAYKDVTECSETSAYKIQTPGNYPEENIQHTEHGESLKSRMTFALISCSVFVGNDYTIKASQVHAVVCAGNFNARIRPVHRLEKHLFTSKKH